MGGVCLKIVRPAHPPPEYMLQQESHKGRLETSGKMPARNPADKVHYIVRFRDWRFIHSVTFGTGRSQNGYCREFNNRRLLGAQIM